MAIAIALTRLSDNAAITVFTSAALRAEPQGTGSRVFIGPAANFSVDVVETPAAIEILANT